MKKVNSTRRQLIKTVCSLPAAACLAAIATTLTGCSSGKPQNNCGAPDEKNAGLRASLKYTDNAASGPSCIDCAYFNSTNTTDACGQCVIFNGPASATGYCTSWSKKA